MALFALIGIAALAMAGLVVGVHLLLLWRRTRQLTELLLGSGILVSGFFGNGMNTISSIVPELAGLLTIPGSLCHAYGCWCTGVVAWRVFRPRSRWAAVVVAIDTALLVIYPFGELPAAGGDLRSPLYWSGALAVSVPYFWITTEAIRYQAALRRRFLLGLTRDNLLPTRMLLWATGLGAIGVAWVVIYAARFFGDREAVLNVVSLSIAVFGLTCATSLWLAFFLPKWLVRRISAAAT